MKENIEEKNQDRDESFLVKFNRIFNKIHFEDSEFHSGGETVFVNPTMKFIAGWAVFLVLLLLFLLIGKPFSGEKNSGGVGSSTGSNIENGNAGTGGQASGNAGQSSGDAGSQGTGSGAGTVNDNGTSEGDSAFVADPNAPLEHNEHSEVNAFVESYFNAYVNCNIAVLSTLVVDPSQYTEEDLRNHLEFASNYSNIDCYTKPGLTENSYVVYSVVNTQIPEVNVQPLSIHQFYLIRNEYGGLVYDNTFTANPEIAEFLTQANQDPDVVKLIERVNENNQASAEADETLRAFYEKIQPQNQEDASGEGSSDSQAE